MSAWSYETIKLQILVVNTVYIYCIKKYKGWTKTKKLFSMVDAWHLYKRSTED